MKKISYIIAEYNPFHNGHKYQLEKTRELTKCDYLAVIMSGEFVQRGEPSVLDPEKRAGIAIENGADIVFELPLQFATASSDYFAYGAMDIIRNIGREATVSFGSESGDISRLKAAAEIMVKDESTMFAMIRDFMGKGESMPRAREKAMESLGLEDMDLLRKSNNILGVEYIKHGMKMMGDNCSFITVKRIGAGYNESIKNRMMSATGIRKDLFSGGDAWRGSVPSQTEKALDRKQCCGSGKMLELLQYSVMKEGKRIRRFRGVVDGLENRIIRAVETAGSLEDAVDAVSTKRYAKTAVKRVFLSIILGLKKDDFHAVLKGNTPYINVLAEGERSRELLRDIKETASCPILNRNRKYPSKRWFAATGPVNMQREIEKRAVQIYRMLCRGN